MTDNFNLRKYLVENKVTANSRMLTESNSKFEEIAAQLISMATNGEIDNDDIKRLSYDLTTARRKMFAGKRSPEQRADTATKGQNTIKSNKLRQQAYDLTNKEMNISNLADQFALELGSHKDGALQAKYNEKLNQILNSLNTEI